jgi:hypothetical protein
MAFDAKQAVTDKITHLEDELKQLQQQRRSVVSDLDTQIDAKQDELDGWVSLLGSESKAEKPAAKKAAAKK